MIISTVHKGTFAAGDEETKVMAAVGWEPEIIPGDNVENYVERAKQMVFDYLILGWPQGQVPPFNLYVVWFCKTLQNWKALVGTTMKDDFYYEVTRNGDAKETYLDVYKKVESVCLRDPR